MQGETYKALLKNRIGGVSLALRDVADTTRRVNERLSGMVSGDLSSVYNAAADRVCRKCKNRSVCWQLKYTDTCNVLNDALGVLRRGRSWRPRQFPAYFSKSCLRLPELSTQMNLLFQEYTARESMRRKVSQVRGVVTDQFEGMALMIDAMGRDLDELATQDGTTAGKVREYLAVAERLSRPRDLHGGRRREHDAGGHDPHLQALAARPDRADGVAVGHLRRGISACPPAKTGPTARRR